MGGHEYKLDGEHDIVVADFFEVILLCIFMSFGGEVGDEECLVLDFGPEESNIGDFIEKINLNQRE